MSGYVTGHLDLGACSYRMLCSSLLAFCSIECKLYKFCILISVSETKPLFFGLFIILFKALLFQMSEMLSSDSQSIDTSFCEFCLFSIVRVSHSYSAPTSDPLTGCRTYIRQIQFVHIQMLKDFVKQDCIIGNKYTSPLECSSLQILLPPCTTACYLSLYSPYCTVFYTVFMV